ncbi:Thaumatin-like protein [Drosera capensis]
MTLLLVSIVFTYFSATSATTLSLLNRCSHPVWPGIQPGAGHPIIARGGFELQPYKATTLYLPALWSGRVWGRHGCSFDSSGRGRCATGDCGGSLYCNGLGGAPPATLVEITLGQEQDFYDVSLVDGYNLALSMTAYGGAGKGKCSVTGCVSDLNAMCPVGLQGVTGTLRAVSRRLIRGFLRRRVLGRILMRSMIRRVLRLVVGGIIWLRSALTVVEL